MIKDCKKHYTEMYRVRMMEESCPFCEIDRLNTELEEARVAKEELEENYLEIGCLSDSREIKELKDKARQKAAMECYVIAQNILVRAMKHDNFIGNAMDDLLDEISTYFRLKT